MNRTFSRAVVTGGAGFIGSHVCDRLISAGTDVLCVDNFATSDGSAVAHLGGHERFHLVEHDVTEPLPVSGEVDLVLHLASAASPRDYLRLPVETLRTGSVGTTNALELAQRTGARFLLASTSEVYGDPLEHPQRETYWGNVNPVGPRSVYDEAKRFGEALTMAYRHDRGVDTTIARIFNTYGPRMRSGDGRVIPTFIGQALRGEPLTIQGSGQQTRSICFVDDTVAGLLALAASTDAGPCNIGNPDELTVLDIAALVLEITASPSGLTNVPLAADDPQRRCPDITRAAQQLGWAPRVDARTGLRKTVAWFVEQLPAAALARPVGSAE